MKSNNAVKFNIIWGAFAAIFISATPFVYAQNFAGTSAAPADSSTVAAAHDEAAGQAIVSADDAKNVESKEDLTDKDVANILTDQGIPAAAVLSKEEASTYTLGSDDIISVTVERHPEVSGDFAINSEGKIQYGFVGDIELTGFNKASATKLITEKLSKYILSPQVTVSILQYNSKVVYVIGEVGSPGKIFMRGDTITVREALLQANLPLLSAKAAKSKLITPSGNGKPKIVAVNVQRLLYDGDLRENLVMKPGDTLYVPPTIMAKLLRVIQPVAAPISAAAGPARVAGY